MTKTTSVSLGDLAAPFDTWCAQRGVSRSFAIRQLVARTIGNCAQPSLPLTASSATRVDEWFGPARRGDKLPRTFTLKLTPEQHDRLRSRAAEAGMSRQRFVLAAITARDSDVESIAGKDEVQALVRSNALLAQAMVYGVGRDGADDRGATSAPCRATPRGDLIEQLREHLSRAARVLSIVELTRAGHSLPKRGVREGRRGEPARPRRDSGTMG